MSEWLIDDAAVSQAQFIRAATDPRNSVTVEACAGSGKTWLLVARIVRALLAGAAVEEILAITFTRKAAQEMRARVHDVLHELQSADDPTAIAMLTARGVPPADCAALLPRARALRLMVLRSRRGLACMTFHQWFTQVLAQAPLGTSRLHGAGLEEASSLRQQEVWLDWLSQAFDHEETGPALTRLIETLGLNTTRDWLLAFLRARVEWWAYTEQSVAPVSDALANYQRLADAAGFAKADSRDALLNDAVWCESLRLFAAVAGVGSAQQRAQTDAVLAFQQFMQLPNPSEAWFDSEPGQALWNAFMTQKNEPRVFRHNASTRSALSARGLEEFDFQRSLDHLCAVLKAQWGACETRRRHALNHDALICADSLLRAYAQAQSLSRTVEFTELDIEMVRLFESEEQAAYVLGKLDAQTRHLLVDEFQDTNPMQWRALMGWLRAYQPTPDGAGLPRLFFVGDPKQSIYRFRRADSRLFRQTADRLHQDFGVLRLRNNQTRRNAPVLLRVINQAFEHERYSLFAPQTTASVSIGGVWCLPSGSALSGASNTGPEALNALLEPNAAAPDTTPTAAPNDALRDVLRETLEAPQAVPYIREGDAIAAAIQSVVGYLQVEDDKAPGGLRAARYGDILILVNRRLHLAHYESALREARIPFVTGRQGALLGTLEALDIDALLTWLSLPGDDLALTQLLRTPVFAFSIEDLRLLKAAAQSSLATGLNEAGEPSSVDEPPQAAFESASLGENPAALLPDEPAQNAASDLWTRLQAQAPTDTRCASVVGQLTRWREWSLRWPVHDVLDSIYADGNWLVRYAQSVAPHLRTQVVANLQALLALSLTIDAGRFPSPVKFRDALRNLRRLAAQEAPNEALIQSEGAVRILTVHAAKGLEAPIVFLPDRGQGLSGREGAAPPLLIDWPPTDPQPRGFAFIPAPAKNDLLHASLLAEEANLRLTESFNLMYVAITRARQWLFVSRAATSDNDRPTGDDWYSRIAALPEVAIWTGNPPEPTAGRPTPEAPDAAVIDFLPQTQVSSEAPDEADPVRAAMGVLLHQWLAHPRTVAAPPEQVPDDWRRAGYACCLEDAQIDQVFDAWRHIRWGPGARGFDAAQYRYAAAELTCWGADGRMLRLDRYVEFADEAWIVDFKLEPPDEHHPLWHDYLAQLRAYAEAMRPWIKDLPLRLVILGGQGQRRDLA